MLIEIKDLPTGRNVKKMSFDIEFEDGDAKNVTTNTKSYARIIHEEMAKDTIDDKFNKIISDDVERTNEIQKPIISDKREVKEVPAEMTNLEF